MLIAVTLLLILASLPHVFEDFHYRNLLGLDVSVRAAIAVLVLAYAFQLGGIVLVLRGDARGALLLAFMGAVWCVGAILVHGHDMLFAGANYRHGGISRALEAFIVSLGLIAAFLGVSATRRLRAGP